MERCRAAQDKSLESPEDQLNLKPAATFELSLTVPFCKGACVAYANFLKAPRSNGMIVG